MSASPLPLTTTSKRANSSDVNSIDSLLSRLQIEQSRSTQLLVTAFEKRNASLWESIESSIRLAEEEERVMEENRRRMMEQEKKAKEMREAEEKRLEEDKKRKEEREKEEERKKKEERERMEKEKEEQEKVELEKDKKALVVKGKMTGEGSPKAEFEKWSAKMNVR